MNKKQLLSITAIGAATLTIVITLGILVDPSDEIFETNAQTILDSCEEDSFLHILHKLLALHENNEEAHCVVNSLESISENEDRQMVLNTFLDIITLLNQREEECHMLGHPLGFFMYTYTENLVESVLLIDRTCGGSLYHGTMQGYFTTKLLSDNGTPSNVVAKKACDELSDVSYSRIRLECVHGVGHGLIIAYNYDVFLAFEACEVFEDGLSQRSCVSGISMENAGVYSTPENATLDEDDLLFPCNLLDVEQGTACIRWHMLYIIRTLDGSVEDAFEECEKNENETFVKYCYYAIGITQTLKHLDDLENVILMCQKGNLNYQTYCFVGGAFTIADEFDVNQAFELCKLLPQMSKMDCYDGLGKWINTMYFTNEEIENVCSQAESEEYYQVCVNANPEGFRLNLA